MLLEQYYLGCLAHASYLLGDESTGIAAVVDPQRDVDQYLADAAARGLRIRYVILTHLHADFVAGHLELRDRTGATICLGARASADYDFRPLADGEEIELGAVRLRTLETPGHSPESISIVVYDLARDADRPHAVLTGDTLFIGDVGRPDLRAGLGWSAEALGGMLYDSLRTKLMALPDETLIYPAHGAGSLCGKHLSSDRVSTIGAQRRDNAAVQEMGREAFLAMLLADQPEAPAYFGYDAVLNARRHPTLDQVLEGGLVPIAPARVLEMAAAGAQLLDTRDPADFEAAHLAGGVNIGLGGAFATWAGTLLEPTRPIVLVAEPGREAESAMRLGRIGFDSVAGYLEGGMDAIRDRPDLLHRIERVTASTLAAMLAGADPPLVLDVRAGSERAGKRIAGSRHLPLTQLGGRLDELPREVAIVTHCAGGYRSAIAASLLARAGVAHVGDLIGGIGAWEAQGLPVETD